MRVHCGDWALDTATRQVARSGDPVCLSPKAFDLLTVLLCERPRAMSKSELLERIWPETFVNEGGLTNLVAQLRSALGDQARQPRYIRTVHRYGYAFCGTAMEDAQESPPDKGPGRLRLHLPDREITLGAGIYVLGRAPEVEIQLDACCVSRRHARIVVDATGASIEDLGSKNGTFLNRARVGGVRALSDGDKIDLGSERVIVFRILGDIASTQTQAE
jgi:DNA-binding winged helix-turn-helix (wHTH) protein